MTAVPPPPGRRKLSRTKRIVFSGILLVLLWGLFEVAAALYLGVSDGSIVTVREQLKVLV